MPGKPTNRIRVYIAGPMRGIARYNFDAFDAVADQLKARGFDPVSPADLDRDAGFDPELLPEGHDWSGLPENFTLADAIRRDIDAIIGCDAIYMLDGWRASKGATAELAIAKWLGLQILYESDGETILDEAQRITSGERDKTYGHPLAHWERTVGMINARFGLNLRPEDWGVCMILDKVARLANGYHRDSLVDIAGYSRCVERCEESGVSRG